jgi:hypothetical protein
VWYWPARGPLRRTGGRSARARDSRTHVSLRHVVVKVAGACRFDPLVGKVDSSCRRTVNGPEPKPDPPALSGVNRRSDPPGSHRTGPSACRVAGTWSGTRESPRRADLDPVEGGGRHGSCAAAVQDKSTGGWPNSNKGPSLRQPTRRLSGSEGPEGLAGHPKDVTSGWRDTNDLADRVSRGQCRARVSPQSIPRVENAGGARNLMGGRPDLDRFVLAGWEEVRYRKRVPVEECKATRGNNQTAKRAGAAASRNTPWPHQRA